MNNFCLFNTQGGFRCKKVMEGFDNGPDNNSRYSIHILVSLGNSIIHDEIYTNISPSSGEHITKITPQWDASMGISKASVRITDNTQYHTQTSIRALRLIIEFDGGSSLNLPFNTGLPIVTPNTVSTALAKRTIEFDLPYYKGFTVLFDTKNMTTQRNANVVKRQAITSQPKRFADSPLSAITKSNASTREEAIAYAREIYYQIPMHDLLAPGVTVDDIIQLTVNHAYDTNNTFYTDPQKYKDAINNYLAPGKTEADLNNRIKAYMAK